MSKNTRWFAKRHLREAINNLDWVLYHFKWLEERYKDYPHIYEPLLQLIHIALDLQKAIDRLNQKI